MRENSPTRRKAAAREARIEATTSDHPGGVPWISRSGPHGGRNADAGSEPEKSARAMMKSETAA